jgi:hypothetical protein
LVAAEKLIEEEEKDKDGNKLEGVNRKSGVAGPKKSEDDSGD